MCIALYWFDITAVFETLDNIFIMFTKSCIMFMSVVFGDVISFLEIGTN